MSIGVDGGGVSLPPFIQMVFGFAQGVPTK